MAPVLVLGATGSQGSAVIDALLERGADVRAYVRDPGKPAARALADRGAELAVGDLTDREALVTAMQGVSAAYGLTLPGPDEQQHGELLLEASAKARVPFLVLASVASAARATEVPHFIAKARVEAALAHTDLHAAVLAPTFFYENLLYRREDVAAGRLPLALPPDQPLRSVSTRDIGIAAATMLTAPTSWMGRRIELVADLPTPREMAAALTQVTGHPVEHVEVPLGAIASDDLRAMYAFLASDGYDADPAAARAALPDSPLTSFADWAEVHWPRG